MRVCIDMIHTCVPGSYLVKDKLDNAKGVRTHTKSNFIRPTDNHVGQKKV